MRKIVRIQGPFRCERRDANVYAVERDGHFVGTVERNEYGWWRAYTISGNVRQKASWPGGEKMMETVIRSF